MLTTQIRRFAGLTLTALLLVSCSLGGVNAPTPFSPPNAEYTAAAQTIIAQLTQIAQPATGTPAGPTLSPGVNGSATGAPQNGPTQTAGEPASGSPTIAPTSQPTPSPEPTQTPSPTPEATIPSSPSPTATGPTATTIAGDPRSTLGAPSWQDKFADSLNWPLYDDEHVHMGIKAEGGLQMIALRPEKWDSWMLSQPVLNDFYMEVTATPGKCSGLDRYGLLARAQVKKGTVSGAYVFGFSCDGQYSLRKWDGKSFSALVGWTSNSLILKGPSQANRLGIMAKGSQLSLYANGGLLTQVEDTSFDSGSFGLFIASANTPNFTLVVSEVDTWKAP